MEVAGPSIFARKIYDAPVFNGQAKSVKWLTTIPLGQFPNLQMNIFMEENFVPETGGPYSIDVSVREQSLDNLREHPYATTTIMHDQRLVTSTYDKRAEAYRILYRYINDLRQLCKEEQRLHYIRQEIVNRARDIMDKHAEVFHDLEWKKKQNPNYTETDTEASARDLASVLLEVEVEEPRTPIAGLRRIFQKGTVWTRVNTRYPTQIAGEKIVEKGEPVDLTVVQVSGECVVFSSPFGDTYLSWPRPPVYAEANEKEVRILDKHGPWLTYTRKDVAEAVSAKDVADASIQRMNQLHHGTIIITPLMTVIQIDSNGNVLQRDEKQITNAEEVADFIEHERSIVRFDVGEIKRHYKTGQFDSIDLADIGYWTKDGEYTPPDPDYRGQLGEANMTAGDLAKKVCDPRMAMKHPFTVSGSWGIWYCLRDGTVSRFDVQVDTADLDAEDQKQIETYNSIVKFNVPEWKVSHPNVEETPGLDIDVLDMGFWLPDGTYEGPDETWRGIHAMNETVDLDVMKDIVDKSMWWTEWKTAPKNPLHMVAQAMGGEGEDQDPINIQGGQSCNLKAPLYRIEGRIGGEVWLMSGRSEHENAIYTWTLHLAISQEVTGQGIQFRHYAESWMRDLKFVEDEWPQVKKHVEGFYSEVLRPLIDRYLKKGGDRRWIVRELKRSIQVRWAKYWKPWGRDWRDVYDKSVYLHYNNQPPPEIVAKLKELRDEDTKNVDMWKPIGEAQMTPKELTIQAIGLPVMAHSRNTEHGNAVRQGHYQWVSDHGYKIKLSIVELFQTAPVIGMKERVVPSYRIIVKTYIETTPTIYDDLPVFTLYDEIVPEKKGKMYTALYQMFQDIETAHAAGMEPADMKRLLVAVYKKAVRDGEELRQL